MYICFNYALRTERNTVQNRKLCLQSCMDAKILVYFCYLLDVKAYFQAILGVICYFC